MTPLEDEEWMTPGAKSVVEMAVRGGYDEELLMTKIASRLKENELAESELVYQVLEELQPGEVEVL